MNVKVISTDKAPAAIGPYSQAVLAGGFLFTSGQIALDPATGEFRAGEIEEETQRVLDNLDAILQAAGLSKRDVLKTTVFMSDLGNFSRMNPVYERFFGEHKPARSTIQAAALPRGAKVEIEAIALAQA
jgi:2-iminobutanoate/2-iminopropanoate deaminase